MRRFSRVFLAFSVPALLACGCSAEHGEVEPERLHVHVAASLHGAMEEVARLFEARHGSRLQVRLNSAGSGTLVRQIAHGAPADVFVSANPAWVDRLTAETAVVIDGRRVIARNSLVLVTPTGSGLSVLVEPGFDFASALATVGSRLAMGEPATVPAGMYARQALRRLGWWSALEGRVVSTQNVRAALALAERGEVAAAIVYETDARSRRGVEKVVEFPATLHDPIEYVAVRVATPGRASDRAAEFLDFLGSQPALLVLERLGFGASEPGAVLGRAASELSGAGTPC